MLSIEELRKTIPEGGKDMSDEEVEKLRDILYKLADFVFDQWLRKREKSKGNKS